MKREASTFMLSWWQRGGAMLMAVPRQWQQRFVVVLGKLTMDVSRGFGGKFTRMCFGSGISSSTSGTAKGSIYSLWLSFVCTCLEPGRVKADICHWL